MMPTPISGMHPPSLRSGATGHAIPPATVVALHGATPEKRKVSNMAADQTRRLSPSILQANVDALDALKGISGYTPVNQDCAVQTKSDAKDATQATETQKQAEAEAEAARDNAVAAEWAFHNAMLAAKDQLKAQFGGDSNE